MHDVIIVGGGPGGLYAAKLLAEQGFDVALYEEHAASGEPVHCTGVLATEAFDELDLPRDVILNPLATARFISPNGATVEYTSPTVEAVAVDRALFDRRVCEQAVGAGAQVWSGLRVTALDVDGAGVTATLGDGTTVRARTAVLACGANYTLQRRLGLGLPGVFLQSAQLEVPASVASHVEVRFGVEIAPRGFAWVVPIVRGARSFARVGLMCERDAAGLFRSLLHQIAPRWQIATTDADGRPIRPKQKILPLAPIPRTFGDRVLAIGDAAGLVKATTGGGIYYSMVSGSLAAETLTAALRRDDLRAAALRPYERAWRRRLGPELKAQLRLRRLAHRLSDPDIEAFFELARTDGVMPIVHRTARFNHHRDLIVSLLRHPPARRVLLRRLQRPFAGLGGRSMTGADQPAR